MLVRTLMIYQNHWPPKKGSNLLPTPRYTEGVLGCTSKEFYEELASVREMQSEVNKTLGFLPTVHATLSRCQISCIYPRRIRMGLTRGWLPGCMAYFHQQTTNRFTE